MHLVIILGKWQNWRTILFCVFISILYMFRATPCSSSGESVLSIQTLVYVTLCKWPFLVQVGKELLSDLHTKRSPTKSDIYQRLPWYNGFSWWWARGCSKHVENWNKYIVQIWCDFDRASSLISENKMPTRCNRGFYCRSYYLLNMFRAPLCPSSGAQEYYTVVAACGISCCGFQVAGLVRSWGLCVRFAGCCSNLKSTARNITGSNHCIILLSSWWWA